MIQLNKERLTVLLAFAAIYIVWGSTYLAIWIGLNDIPPFLMSALRFLVAGFILRVREGQPVVTVVSLAGASLWWQSATRTAAGRSRGPGTCFLVRSCGSPSRTRTDRSNTLRARGPQSMKHYCRSQILAPKEIGDEIGERSRPQRLELSHFRPKWDSWICARARVP